MGIEIERKFLVCGEEWKSAVTAQATLRQGFLSTEPERTVRVRLLEGEGILTVKGLSRGSVRSEYEYAVPENDAAEMLDQLCLRPLIEKTRYLVPFSGMTWEVDVFSGENQGLCIAEVELTEEDQEVALPPWVGREVTGDPRYYNANLIRHPYSRWMDEGDVSG